MKKLLITGFDAFGDDDFNPSFEAVKMLPDTINNIELIKLQLPTKFIEAKDNLLEALDIYKPDYVILTGQAAGRKEISLERVAINLMDARIEDNVKYQPKDVIIDNEGKNAYFTNYDIRRMEEFLIHKEIPVKVSYTAGTYVCNSTYYNLMNTIEKNNLDIKGIFIHIPIIPSQKKNYKEDYFTLELDDIKEAFYTIIESIE